jgi:ABC-type Mn2+/Zn2+ transport system permease subunit
MIIPIFKETFFVTSLLSGILVSVLCSYAGVYVHFKNIIFFSIALSEVSALGVLVGLLIGVQPVIASFIFIIVCIILILFSERDLILEKIFFQESIIGFIYIFCVAVSILLISKNPIIESSGVDIIKGNLLYSQWNDVILVFVISLIVLLVHFLFYRHFIYVSFDKTSAQAKGIKTNLVEFVLFVIIGIIISVSIKISGVLFVFSSLVLPPMCGLVYAKNMNFLIIISFVFAITSVFLGLLTSYFFDLPASPTIVVFYILFFLILYGIKKFKKR